MFLVKTWRSAVFGLYGYLNFTKSGFVDHSKKFAPEDKQVRIDGKNCLVTGANSGIGFATAKGLAERGGNVYLICRNRERGETAASEIRSITLNQNVYLEVCDISSVSEVKSFASRFSSKDTPVHVLVNNAGILEQQRITTSEGFELNFAVNVLGTFSMTELMLPLLEKAAPDARVITVSSGGMYTSPLTRDLQYSDPNFNGVEQYARNKRLQVALTEKWANLYDNKGIGFYSMHPGWADTPGVAKSLPGFSKSYASLHLDNNTIFFSGSIDSSLFWQTDPSSHIFIRLSGNLRTSDEGADTVIWLAIQPKEKLKSGSFYFDRAEAPKHLKFAATGGHSAALIDDIINDLRSMSSISSRSG